MREVLVEAIGRALAAVTRSKMRQAGSPMLAIGLRINPYEYRCSAWIPPGRRAPRSSGGCAQRPGSRPIHFCWRLSRTQAYKTLTHRTSVLYDA